VSKWSNIDTDFEILDRSRLAMAEDQIVINAGTFFDRLSHFYTSWKADKRSGGDALFGGVGSIVVLAGKNEKESVYPKNTALHVSRFRPTVEA
jgi:nucleosome binding factor SPN SPT16 subunit